MDNSCWATQLILALRCTSSGFAHSFVERGEVKFNTPKSWEQYGIEGRGDLYEGVMAITYETSPDKRKLIPSVGNSYTINDGKRILIKNAEDMKLPGLCFYGLWLDDFPVPEREGWNHLSTTIEPRYFRDFADGMTLDKVLKLPEDKRPAVVAIKNFDEFILRLKRKLISIGVEDNDILVRRIQYIECYDNDWTIQTDLLASSPFELFMKSRRKFSYQHEVRIIVNTHDSRLQHKLDSLIEIGNISDIAKVADTYCDNGVVVSADFNCYRIEE